MIDGFASGAVPLPTGGFAVTTGTINGPPPFGVNGVPPGVVYAPPGQPVTVIGPNGQPIMLRSPVPGFVPVPGGFCAAGTSADAVPAVPGAARASIGLAANVVVAC